MRTRDGQVWRIREQELPADTPIIMGILNVTPDSFSDGGKSLAVDDALMRARQMQAEGAVIIDIGGESTRPGAESVDSDTEIHRVLPVIRELTRDAQIIVSIDTRKSEVAAAALEAGASIVNDVSAGTHDPHMLELVARSKAGMVLMHMQGSPTHMQNAPSYVKVTEDIKTYFAQRIEAAQNAGIARECLVLDPGIGFGKTLDHNLELMAKLSHFDSLGLPILLGASRKSFIGMIDGSAVDQRIGGSLAAVLAAYLQGVRLFRVHDVQETRQILDIFHAIQSHSD